MVKTKVLVVCVEAPGQISVHSQQLIQKAHSLIDEKEGIVSVFCNEDYDQEFLRSLSTYGADEIIYSKAEYYDYRELATVIADYIQDSNNKPQLILVPGTDWGKCIAADLAIKIGGGLTAECIDIEAKKVDGEYQFISTRAAINSSVLAQIQCINTMFTICTFKKNVFSAPELLSAKDIPIYELESKSIPKSASRVLKSELITENVQNTALEISQIVFGIGRGIKDKDGIELVEKVAKKYNAAIVGTRALVEEGMIDKKCQVGQSGIYISPQIYVAIGISGATQHIVGIKNAKKIISINTDPEAPIFKFSDYCIVDDYKKVLVELV